MGREEIDRAYEQQQKVIDASPAVKHMTIIVLALAIFGLYHLIILIINIFNQFI